MIGPSFGSPVSNRDLDWEHYPENDILPEHFSSVYGLVINIPGTTRWEAWVLSTVLREPKRAEDIQVDRQLGDYSTIQTAKRAVLGFCEQNLPAWRTKAAAA